MKSSVEFHLSSTDVPYLRGMRHSSSSHGVPTPVEIHTVYPPVSSTTGSPLSWLHFQRKQLTPSDTTGAAVLISVLS